MGPRRPAGRSDDECPAPDSNSQTTEENETTVKMLVLGRTGIQVSSYCLGAMMLGPVGIPDQDDCARIIHRALDAGINFIDTADVYRARRVRADHRKGAERPPR